MRAKKREFKKKVVLSTGSIFVCTCIVALIFSWNEKPTEVFTYIIPTAGGVFGAAVIWYLKAVQLENGIKIQLGMIKKLIDMGEENPAEEIKERTIQKMKDKTEAGEPRSGSSRGGCRKVLQGTGWGLQKKRRR